MIDSDLLKRAIESPTSSLYVLALPPVGDPRVKVRIENWATGVGGAPGAAVGLEKEEKDGS
jgi:hypothetical protein